MGNIAKNLPELIGNTPMLELSRYTMRMGVPARIVAKLESFNPLSSVKDRVGYALILDAEARGALKPGATIIEPTSGNTGVGLAFVAASRGYSLILTMPDTMSQERRALLAALGARIVLTPGARGMKGAIETAEELLRDTPGAFMPRQFENPANPAIHRQTTGEEIWRDMDGALDCLIACVGTGGTVSGCGVALKSHDPSIHIVGVEPAESPVLSGGAPGPHGIQGIGAGFVPKNFDASLVDEIHLVATEAAREAARIVARTEGLLVGISSGAALHAACELGRLPRFQGKTLVALLPDTGERYLSTGLYEE